MKYSIYFLLLIGLCSCKTGQYNFNQLQKNGEVIISMKRTPCFGRCPIYGVSIYSNGLLIYNAEKFTDTTGCFYTVLNKQQIDSLKEKFRSANFFELAGKYPEHDRVPTDLPSCILYFKDGEREKTVTDRRWNSPKILTDLETSIDALLNLKTMKICDKIK